MHELLDKVIILSGNGGTGKLLKTVNIKWNKYFGNSSGFSKPSNVRTTKYMKRIYPPGDIKSAHFSLNIPYKKFHAVGCQFVAMNYQTMDGYMKDYLKFFRNSSFVLKPKNLR